ncbi:hypothetical protein FB639_005244 [Coemansia asiatica]|nr:hypothetical protein FB639_005244 [Coemansia asiatica]
MRISISRNLLLTDDSMLSGSSSSGSSGLPLSLGNNLLLPSLADSSRLPFDNRLTT